MELGAIFVGLSMMVASTPFVIRPFRENRFKSTRKAGTHPNPGKNRQAVLSTIHDLDFDFQTGKVSEEDYTTLRARLVAEAATFIESEKSISDDQIEALVKTRKESQSKTRVCTNCGNTVEADSRFCSQCGEALVSLCPSCGKPAQEDDYFCTACGAKLGHQAEAAA